MQMPDMSLKTKTPCFYLRTPLLRRRTAVVIVSGRDARAQRTKGSKECEKGMGSELCGCHEEYRLVVVMIGSDDSQASLALNQVRLTT